MKISTDYAEQLQVLTALVGFFVVLWWMDHYGENDPSHPSHYHDRSFNNREHRQQGSRSGKLR
jgi:hypothetical protein